MSLFYIILALILVAIVLLFYYQRRERKNKRLRKQMPQVDFNPPDFTRPNKSTDSQLPSFEVAKSSPYDPNLIVLQIEAFPGKPYMGYELHQALLSAGLRFGEKNIFHCHPGSDDNGGNRVLFSLAAATPSGSFTIEDMGAFKCNGLLLFMHLDREQKLMASFDLMLDAARQLAEELGGEIYDDLHQSINADVIKRLREKICTVETGNLYVSDLLDNLD